VERPARRRQSMEQFREPSICRYEKPVLSAAARAKIGKAAKKRWAKFRAEAKKLALSLGFDCSP
jgi:hypothetical protein